MTKQWRILLADPRGVGRNNFRYPLVGRDLVALSFLDQDGTSTTKLPLLKGTRPPWVKRMAKTGFIRYWREGKPFCVQAIDPQVPQMCRELVSDIPLVDEVLFSFSHLPALASLPHEVQGFSRHTISANRNTRIEALRELEKAGLVVGLSSHAPRLAAKVPASLRRVIEWYRSLYSKPTPAQQPFVGVCLHNAGTEAVWSSNPALPPLPAPAGLQAVRPPWNQASPVAWYAGPRKLTALDRILISLKEAERSGQVHLGKALAQAAEFVSLNELSSVAVHRWFSGYGLEAMIPMLRAIHYERVGIRLP